MSAAIFTNTDFLRNLILQKKYLFYRVWKGHSPIPAQLTADNSEMDDPTPQDCADDCLNFVSNLTGDFTLRLYYQRPTLVTKKEEEREGNWRSYIFKFSIKGADAGIGGISASNGGLLPLLLAQMEKNTMLQLEMMQQKHEADKGDKDDSATKVRSAAMLKGILLLEKVADKILGTTPAAAPIGKPATETKTESPKGFDKMSDQEKDELARRLSQAIKDISQALPNYLEVLEELAKMARENPAKLQGLANMMKLL